MNNKELPNFSELIDKYEFEMFSRSGNTACKNLMKRVYKKVSGSKRISKESLFDYIKSEQNKIVSKHPEIGDTEPEWHITYLTKVICNEFDYTTDFDRYDIFI